MYSAADILSKKKGVNLCVATIYNGNELMTNSLDGIDYYMIPCKKGALVYDKRIERYWVKINNDIKPDIVHIYGTELPHGYAFIKSCGSKNVIVSLQGIVGVYSKYFLSGFDICDIIKNPILLLQKAHFCKNNAVEKKVLTSVKYFEGRSEWDNSVVWSFNPKASYYHCNRTLRPGFYSSVHWSINNCDKYTIFLSQASSPIKGIHQIIRALPIIRRHFPKCRVIIAGDSIFNHKTLKDKIKFLGYRRFISGLLKKYDLMGCVKFAGQLDELGMRNMYIKSHVFVCPSSIENVPNSIGEAQITGIPCIASYVGGNSSLIDHGYSGFLYRFEEYEMLAWYVCKIFADSVLAERLSKCEVEQAEKRYDSVNNCNVLVNIYNTIINKEY